MNRTNRRTWCAAAAATLLAPGLARAAAEPGVTANEIVIGQVLAISGPLAGLMPDIINGAGAWFAGVNERGGIHGRKVKLVNVDDGYVPANSIKAVQRLIAEDPTFALLNMTGTGNVAAILPQLEQERMPLFGPITGADSLRKDTPLLFHLRASYADETEKIVQHLTTLGIQRIAAVYLDNGFGKDGLAGIEKAMAKRNIKLVARIPVQQDASDVDKGVASLLEARPDVTVLITTGKATVDFIKKANATRKGMRFYALSVMGTQSTLRALGPDGVGVVVTSVVPFPWSANAAAREYRDAMKRAGFDNLSFMGFEAYLNAKAMTEGLRRAGKDLTRAKFVRAVEGIKRLDLGGFEVGYGEGQHQGSRYVELTIIGPGEKFTK